MEYLINEIGKWKRHPAILEISVHLAHMLMCLGRREDAGRLFKIFKSSKVSRLAFSSWLSEEAVILENEFAADTAET